MTIIGGGPGGLFAALLCKKAKPDWDIEIFERNKADDTFGFGVVFSDETLDEFLSRDKAVYNNIRNEFAYWDDVAIHYKGKEIRIAGNGFCGTKRHTLLRILQDRCIELGVKIVFGTFIDSANIQTQFAESDIIVVSDGINSEIRNAYKHLLAPTTKWRSNRFCWMGSTRPMGEFNYFFRETEHGIIVAHCYQYEKGHSTWVFEMDESTWSGHGFEEHNEENSKAKLEDIFAEELHGHPLLLNRSNWRNFPSVFCENWFFENVVMLGDAKASAHFSIGSGTKLAMECAIGLSDALIEHAEESVQKAFQVYDDQRRTPVQITQHNANVSLAWFEHMKRSWDMEPYLFAMVVLCRANLSPMITDIRDKKFIEDVDTEWYERTSGIPAKTCVNLARHLCFPVSNCVT